MGVFRGNHVTAEFAEDRVGKGGVDVEVVLVHDIVAAVHGDAERVVIDAGSVRVNREAVREVIQVTPVHLDTLARLGLHGAFLVHRVPGGTAVFLAALDPFEKLVVVPRRQADVVGRGGPGSGLVHGDAAVGGDDLGNRHAGARIAGTPDRLRSPLEHSLGIIHLDAVGLAFVYNGAETTVIVDYDTLRVHGTVEVGVRDRGVVSTGEEHHDPASRKVGSVLGLELGSIRV